MKRKSVFICSALCAILSLQAQSKVTLDDAYEQNRAAGERRSARIDAMISKTPFNPAKSSSSSGEGWKQLYSGNTTGSIKIPKGVANLYVTTTTGQSYFIPVVAPASNFASLPANGGYVYARWTGSEIKGERKVTSHQQCTNPPPSRGEQNRPRKCRTINTTHSIGITRVMVQ